MSSPVKASFNFAADKVVQLNEWQKRLRDICQAELTVGETFFLKLVDKPLSAVIALGVGVQDALGAKVRDGLYIDPEDSQIYVSGAFVEDFKKAGDRFAFSKSFQERTNKLSAQAFDQSQDYRDTPVMRRLKPGIKLH